MGFMTTFDQIHKSNLPKGELTLIPAAIDNISIVFIAQSLWITEFKNSQKTAICTCIIFF